MNDFWIWTKWFLIFMLGLLSIYLLKFIIEFWDGLETESLRDV